MNTSVILAILVLLASWTQAPQALAHDPAKDPKSEEACENFLTSSLSNTYLIPSGTDGNTLPTYHEMIEDIFGEKGVVRLLHGAVPKHQVEFVSNTEMAMLNAAGGHHPIGNWIDGSKLANAKGAGALEFVWGGVPGCSACRAYYTNTVTPNKNLFILLHVAGHNDFSEHSMYWDVRATDTMAASLKLYELIESLYRTENHDEVSQWYQYLSSLQSAQDYARSSYDSPASLAPEKADLKTGAHPRRPTPSVLQAVAANLPPTAPRWKKEVALLYEEMVRAYTYVVATKGMNEGWATLFMELLAQYLPDKYRTDQFALEYAELLSGVVGGKGAQAGNPYWLGREAWRNLRRRFHERPDIRNLPTELEKDQKFVDYAHTLIDQMNDYDFYRMALDERWVQENKLYLARKAVGSEVDPTQKPPQPGLEQKIITSTGKRVVNQLARQTSDHTLHFARIMVDQVHAFGRDVLSMKHEVHENIPLKRHEAAETLFVLSRIQERAVSLETIAASTWVRSHQGIDAFQGGALTHPFIGPRAPWDFPQPSITTFPIRIEVEPNGRVQVFRKSATGETLHAELTQELQKTVEGFKADVDFGLDKELSEKMERKLLPAMISGIVDGATQSAMGMLSHTPTAARALLEYANMVERRLAASLRNLLSGKSPIKFHGKSVRIQVLPTIPEFQLDQALFRQMMRNRGIPPVDNQSVGTFALSFGPPAVDPSLDDGSIVGKGSVKPGDKIWGPGENEGNGGPGDGQGDEDETEDGDDPSPNHGPGGAKETHEIDIDLGTLGELLLSEFELPNMKRTQGRDHEMDFAREGGTHRPSGNMLWERMIPQVLTLGKMALKEKGKDPRKALMRDVLREGFKRVQPQDYIVSSSEPVPVPDKRAVLVRVADLTGSMAGKPQELEKKFFKLIEALLRAKYREVEIRSIGYDDTAEEFPGDQIFRKFKGGGNTDSTGYILAEKILGEYNPAEWNFYVIGAGDAGSTDGAATVAAMERLYEICQYMGFAFVNVSGGQAWGDMLPAIQSFAADKEWFGLTTLIDDASILPAIQEFFSPKKDEKK